MRLFKTNNSLILGVIILICYFLILSPRANFLTGNFCRCAIVFTLSFVSVSICCSYTTVFLKIIFSLAGSASITIFSVVVIVQKNIYHNICITCTDIRFVGCNSCLIQGSG